MKKYSLYQLPNTQKRVNLIKSLEVVETVSAPSGCFYNKKNKDCYILILDKMGSSRLCFLCNYEFGLGDFVIIPEQFLKDWEMTFCKITNYGLWRGRQYPEIILERYKNAGKELIKLEMTLAKAIAEVSSGQIK